MKIVRIPYPGPDSGDGAIVLPDTARANRGEAIYLADSSRRYELLPFLYLRMRGVCKGVSPAGIPAYIDDVGFALHIVDRTQLQAERASAQPFSRAMTYDRALIAGPTLGRSRLDPHQTHEFILEANGHSSTAARLPAPDGVQSQLSALSQWMSLNTGDWVLIPLQAEGYCPEQLPVRLKLHVDGQLELDEYIK